MRIQEVETILLQLPMPGGLLGGSAARPAQPYRRLLVIRLRAENGETGYGESYGTPAAVAAIVQETLAPVILQRDARDVEILWQEMYQRIGYHGPGGVMLEALSGIDIALWDLKGKALGVPLSVLLGGYRPQVPVYAASVYLDTPDAMARQALRFAEQGFAAIKIKIGRNPALDAETAAAVRAAVGNNATLMADANGAYDARTARQVGRRLDALGYAWLEEPVATWDVEGYRRVGAALDLAIAGGEGHYTRWGFRDLIARGQVDVLQPDLTRCGGVSEARAIAQLASAYHRKFSPHCWSSVFGLAAAVHLAAAGSNTLNLEYDAHPNPIKDCLLGRQLCAADGWLAVPEAAGLGLRVDEAAFERCRVPIASSRPEAATQAH